MQQRNQLAHEVAELQIREHELEHSAALASNPKLSWYEDEMQKHPGVATAYSCGGITTEAERLMNCPNGKTATGTVPTVGHTMACEKRLLGRVVQLTFSNGKSFVGHCSDTGGAITNDRFDIYMADLDTAREFGRQHVTYVVR